MLDPKKVTAINAVCLNCIQTDCPGECAELRKSIGQEETSQKKTIEWHGHKKSVSEWAEIFGIPRSTIYRRMRLGLSPDEILEVEKEAKQVQHTESLVEEVYLRLSRMHHDYVLYWDKPNQVSDSAGMVTNYNKVQISPTNKVGSIVEQKAIPELMLSEDATERRAWIACVLYLINVYRTRPSDKHHRNLFKARLLEWRAIDGYTMPKIVEMFNEDAYRKISIIAVRTAMTTIVNDLIDEAVRRGLLVEPQKQKKPGSV